MKILLHFQFSLLLLERICGQTHQFRVRSRELCNETSHYYESSHGVCCTKCPPGTFAFQRCNTKNDTQCHPCTNGTYTEKWNYANRCKTCRPCDSVTGLIVQDNCSTTHQTICKCPQDFSCLDEDSRGRCQTCSPLLIPSTMEPEDPTQGMSVWIIAVSLTVSVSVGILLLFLVWNKPHLGKEIGYQGASIFSF
ncbi:tumor necrosis factor receptor superfamily member 3 [Rhinophrynus dorsalis]